MRYNYKKKDIRKKKKEKNLLTPSEVRDILGKILGLMKCFIKDL